METQAQYDGISIKQYPTRNTAQEVPNTAAQDALGSLERFNERLRELRTRLSTVADHLGVGLPLSDAKAVPCAVRSGIIGSIHSTVDDADSILGECHEYMSQIERQV